MSKTLIVTEMFGSIQGESTHAGRLCYFIRLAGCNLRCNYCDTDYSLSADDGSEITIETIVERVQEESIRLVEITGGEPLVQPNVVDLCDALLEIGCDVMVETNGAMDISVLPEGVIRIVDCKTLSSGEHDRMDFGNFDHLTVNDEVKFVVANRADYDCALSVIDKYRVNTKTRNILLSPAWKEIEPMQIVEWMLEDRPPARLQIQMHKVIWDPDLRGV